MSICNSSGSMDIQNLQGNPRYPGTHYCIPGWPQTCSASTPLLLFSLVPLPCLGPSIKPLHVEPCWPHVVCPDVSRDFYPNNDQSLWKGADQQGWKSGKELYILILKQQAEREGLEWAFESSKPVTQVL